MAKKNPPRTKSDTDENLPATIQKRYPVLFKETFSVTEAIELNLDGEKLPARDMFPRIKIPSGETAVFNTSRVPTLPKTSEFLEGVILQIGNSRARFKYAYDDPKRKKGDRPLCFSNDNVFGIGDPGGECEACPYNEFGSSSKTESNAKGCPERKLHFLLLPGLYLPVCLDASPTNIKAMTQYMIELGMTGLQRHHVITKIGLESAHANGNDYVRLTYEMVEEVTDPDILKRIDAYREGLLPFITPDGAALERARKQAAAEGAGEAPSGAQEQAATDPAESPAD